MKIVEFLRNEIGAQGGIRTHKGLLPTDLKSGERMEFKDEGLLPSFELPKQLGYAKPLFGVCLVSTIVEHQGDSRDF